MRVRLLKSVTTTCRKYFVGTVINVTNSYAKKLIAEGVAFEYKGEYPPKKARISLGRGEKIEGTKKIQI